MRRVAVLVVLFALAGCGGYGPSDAPPVPKDCRSGADADEIAIIQRADTVRKG
jgi:predicted small lipoprotein YifL